jgi:hypothetical protein
MCVGLAAAALVGWSANATLAQTPADGWSGQIQCVINVRAAASGYEDDQTHTWTLTGAAIPRNDFRDYPAAWTVVGAGSRAPADKWTRNGSAANGSITLFVPVGTNSIRVAVGPRALKAAGGIQGTMASVPFKGDADEWRFQYIDTPDGTTRTSFSGSRTLARTDLVGWRQPASATVTETCSWNFAKGTALPFVASGRLANAPVASRSFDSPRSLPGLAPRTITLEGFTAAGTTTAVAPRTMTLAGFTAAGTTTAVAPRTIPLTGFTAAGNTSAVAPRTITLLGFTAVGTAPAVAAGIIQRQR